MTRALYQSEVEMIGMKTKLGTVDAECGSPDGRLMVRIKDRWLLADEMD